MDWGQLEHFGVFYSCNGRPGVPTRFMIGLHILKHMFGLPDESMCERWVENPYLFWLRRPSVQYFCGEYFFKYDFPHEYSYMTHWRKRMGPESLEFILQWKPHCCLKRKGSQTKRPVEGGGYDGSRRGHHPSDWRQASLQSHWTFGGSCQQDAISVTSLLARAVGIGAVLLPLKTVPYPPLLFAALLSVNNSNTVCATTTVFEQAKDIHAWERREVIRTASRQMSTAKLIDPPLRQLNWPPKTIRGCFLGGIFLLKNIFFLLLLLLLRLWVCVVTALRSYPHIQRRGGPRFFPLLWTFSSVGSVAVGKNLPLAQCGRLDC